MFLCFTISAQRLNVETYTGSNYKKHFTHSIEVASELGSIYSYVVGNRTDMGDYSQMVTGHKQNSTNLLSSKSAFFYNESYRIHVTDFTMETGYTYNQAAATGIYYPYGTDEEGYPFLAIYDRSSGQIITFRYYNLLYPVSSGMHDPQTVGLRINYSPANDCYYICGVMSDREFGVIDFNNMQVNSYGFIMKVSPDNQLAPQVLEFTPDAVQDPKRVSVISDIKINAAQSKIAFTGINTKSGFTSYQQPMTGIIDMNLNIDWCNAYDLGSTQYSGTDVIFNSSSSGLFVLHNSNNNTMSVMELDITTGTVIQNPSVYNFYQNTTGDITRAHMMHLSNNSLIITGNHFTKFDNQPNIEHQLLYRFDLNALNLTQVVTPFTYYSDQETPTGKQKEVYAYWTPENSVLENGYLNLVGVYNDNNTAYGYTLVDESGIDPHCVSTFKHAQYEISQPTSILCKAKTETCPHWSASPVIQNFNPPYQEECLISKEMTGINESQSDQGINILGIYNGNLTLEFTAESSRDYDIKICDAIGRVVYSNNLEVNKGKNMIKLPLDNDVSMYLIILSDGKSVYTKKVINTSGM